MSAPRGVRTPHLLEEQRNERFYSFDNRAHWVIYSCFGNSYGQMLAIPVVDDKNAR